MKNTNIEKGYQLHVKTWENDSDHHKTHIINGLTKEDVSFLITLFSHFKIDNLGNEHTAKGDILTAFLDAKAKHPKVSEHFKQSWHLYDDEIQNYDIYVTHKEDFIAHMLSTNGIERVYESGYWRVFDGYEVFFIPEEIHNVTSKFRKS